MLDSVVAMVMVTVIVVMVKMVMVAVESKKWEMLNSMRY